MLRDRPAPGRALFCALIALALPRPASAVRVAAATMASVPRPGSGPRPAAPLELFVNGGSRGPVEVALRDGDALVAVEDLEAAGLRGFEGDREVLDGREHVSLRSLAPALRFEIDEPGLALRLSAERRLLGRTAVDLRPVRRPAGLEVGGDPSAFLNYSIQHRTARWAGQGGSATTGFAEAGASAGGTLLYSSGQLLAGGAAVRGLSSLTVDDPGSLRRIVVGDAFAPGAGLGGGVLLGGVSLSREHGLDPYRVRSPMPGVSGFAPTPSTLEVYVNGVLSREIPLPPGEYDVANLPVTTGAGAVRAVLRDAFGRTQVLDSQYYFAPGLLAPGLSDYGYALGFRRLAYGSESFEYGRPAFLGRHRLGVTERVTLGGRLEAAEDLASGGPSVTFALPFGALDLEAAASAQGGRHGAAASVAWGFVARRFGAGASVRVLSDGYAHAALSALDDRARVQASVHAGGPVGAGLDLGMSYTLLDRRDAGFSDALSARADLRLGRAVTLGLAASRSRARGEGAAHDVIASLSWSFAPASVADVSVRAVEGGEPGVFAGVQRGLPPGRGFGYRARAASAPQGESGTALLQLQGDHGRYEVQYDRTAAPGLGASEVATATVAGGAVLLGGRAFLGRPVQSGYGLIRTGVPGVRGYAEGQEIGRTDGRGDLLVPSLLPYYGNRLAIADADVPVEYAISDTELLAAPAFRGGVVTRFALSPIRSAAGELFTIRRGRETPPAYGELTVRAPGGAFASPVGKDGRFYLEGVPPGVHAGEVEWSEGRCTVAVVVPASPPVVDLGRVRCNPEATAQAGAWTSAVPQASAGPEATEGEARRSGAAVEGESRTTGAAASTSPAATRTPPKRAPTGRRQLTSGCPRCGVCWSAAVERLSGDPGAACSAAALRAGPRGFEASACPVKPDAERLCVECLGVRRSRRCPGSDRSPAALATPARWAPRPR